MLLSEVYEEIIEKSPNTLSPRSIIRKINQVRNQLLRTYGRDIELYRMDIETDLSTYPWPYSAGSISDVLVNGDRYPFGQMNSKGLSKYYYLLSGTIGIYPTPKEDIPQGLTIFHQKTLTPLTINDMNAEVGFDPDYDMLIVYGVLIDIMNGNESTEYKTKYAATLKDFLTANAEPEPYKIQMGEW